MLSEELILHFVPRRSRAVRFREKSLIRATRNADIDADALVDDDLDYREFMADLIKRRRRLAPIRLEMSRALGGDMVEELCKYGCGAGGRGVPLHRPPGPELLFESRTCCAARGTVLCRRSHSAPRSLFPGSPSCRRSGTRMSSSWPTPMTAMEPVPAPCCRRRPGDRRGVISIKMTLYRMAKPERRS